LLSLSVFAVAACNADVVDDESGDTDSAVKADVAKVDLTTFTFTSRNAKLFAEVTKEMQVEIDSIAKIVKESNDAKPAEKRERLPPTFEETKAAVADILAGKATGVARKPVPASVKAALDSKSLTEVELYGLYYYTTPGYTWINPALRTKDPVKLQAVDATILAAASALNKLEGVKCEPIRSSNLPQAVYDQVLKTGTFKDNAFLSTTVGTIPDQYKAPPAAGSGFVGPLRFHFEAERCRSISWLSSVPDENEVLFSPGTEFKMKITKGEKPTATESRWKANCASLNETLFSYCLDKATETTKGN